MTCRPAVFAKYIAKAADLDAQDMARAKTRTPSVPIRSLTPEVSVAAQIAVTDLEALRDAGFRSVVCHRPDFEERQQPPFSVIAAMAETLGLAVAYQPVQPSQYAAHDVATFQQHLHSLPRPLLAYCRSGTRSATLWALAEAGRRPSREILKRAFDAGYDLTSLGPRLPE